jgi:hypothetical protein
MNRRGLLFAAVLVSCAAACSEKETPKADSDAGFVGREGDTEEPQPVDPGPVDPEPIPDAGPADTGGTGTCTAKIVINEILTEGGAINREFIELYNPNTCDVVIDGFKLRYKSAAGTPPTGTLLHTFAVGTTIKAKGYYVVGTAGYTNMAKNVTFSATDNTGNGFLSTSSGQVALFDAMDVKLDGVGYGNLTGGDYVEVKAAPVCPANASIQRKTDGVDTEDNSKDCDWFTTPTPGAKKGL